MSNGTFISPVPKEYSTYSDQEKLQKTEEYYEKMTNLYKRIDNSMGEYLVRVNNLLQVGATWKEIVKVLREKEAQILCCCSYDFSLLEILCNVAEMEERFEERSVLQNIHSMEELSIWHQKCVFLIRRFEMDWEEDDELMLLLNKKQVSYILLVELICKEWISRKIHTGNNIARYLYAKGLNREALLFLMWLEQRLPYSDRKIMTFVTTLLDMKEWKLAYGILSKHHNPDESILELKNTLRDLV